jgi:hypothetical protein
MRGFWSRWGSVQTPIFNKTSSLTEGTLRATMRIAVEMSGARMEGRAIGKCANEPWPDHSIACQSSQWH